MPDAFEMARKPDEPALTTAFAGRRIAHPFALAAKKLGLRANAVTIAAGACWLASLPLPAAAALSGSRSVALGVWFAAGFLWNAGYILDMADGSLARMTGTACKRGFYLDYVFHLLFKPAFLASVGLGLGALSHDGAQRFFFTLLSLVSIPANWSATQSAVEHVLCESAGKNPADLRAWQSLGPAAARVLWLGLDGINESAASKRSAPARFVKTCVQEIFSYYGQFTFFSAAVLADVLIAACGGGRGPGACAVSDLRVTAASFVVVSLVLSARIPWRMAREYKRATLADKR